MNRTKIIIFFIIFFILFSMAPTFYEWNARGRTHDDRFFELVHNFPTDYNLYLSRIREGKEGAWTATEKYTSEPHAGSLSQILYVLIGRLADNSHVQTPYVWFAYHTARIFFAALLLWVIWRVVEWAVPSTLWQFLTFLLIVTASTWPKFEVVAGVPRFGGYMSWYTMTDSLQRTTFHPHVLLAQTLIVFILWVFSSASVKTTADKGGFITKNLPGNWIFLGIVGLILGITFPPGLLFVYGVLGIVTTGEFLPVVIPGLTRNPGTKAQNMDPGSGAGMTVKNWWRDCVYGRFIFGLVSLPSLVYFYLLLQEYPWKRLVEFDVLHPTHFSFIEYFQVMGPVMVLGIIATGILVLIPGIGGAVIPGIKRLKYFIAWVVAWVAFMFVFDKIPQQSPTRFTQMAPHIPLGILAGYTLWNIGTRISNIGKQKNNAIVTHIRYAIFLVPLVGILLGLGSMASSYMWQRDFVDHKLRATLPIVPSGAQVMYPMREIIDGLTWLQIYTPRSSVVLSAMTTGNYIPVYAGNTAYVGHANTVRLEEKLAASNNFYSGRLSAKDAYRWLKDKHILYVFYGLEEREVNGGASDLREYYSFLEQVYESPNVRIYQVQ